MARAVTVDDYARIARRRLPRFVFDFLDGGAGEELGISRNRQSFERRLLFPRYMRGTVADSRVRLFGREYAAPFGIAPTGMSNMFHPAAEEIQARLAARFDVPIALSTVSSTSVERIASIAGSRTWFQVYYLRDETINAELWSRAREAGVEVMVLTVDTPTHGNRLRSMPVGTRLDAGAAWQVATHPRWAISQLLAGGLSLGNLEPWLGRGLGPGVMSRMVSLLKPELDLRDLDRLRAFWKGPLVVKGILHAADARIAVEHGADGIWVSNHGARQLDAAPAALDCLNAVRDAVGKSVTLIMDSGVRSGEDVIKAGAAGADAVFSGRSLLYAIGAAGGRGGADLLGRFTADIRRTLIQIGCPSFGELDDSWLRNAEDST